MSPVEEITTDFKMMNLSTRDHLMSFYRDWARVTDISLHRFADGRAQQTSYCSGCSNYKTASQTAKGLYSFYEDETEWQYIVKLQSSKVQRPTTELFVLAVTGNSNLKMV